MVVVTVNSTALSSSHTPHLHTTSHKPSSFSLLNSLQIYTNTTKPTRSRPPYSNGALSIRSYMEDNNSLSSLANRVIGSLPIIGLAARIFNDEGGLGGDIIDFAEFRRRVGKKCSINDSRAFYEFQDRRGRVMIFIFT